MERPATHCVVLETGAKIAYSVPVVAATMIVGATSGKVGPGYDWPVGYSNMLCGYHGPEWEWTDSGGTSDDISWHDLTTVYGGCGQCSTCSPKFQRLCPPNAVLLIGLIPACKDPETGGLACDRAIRATCPMTISL